MPRPSLTCSTERPARAVRGARQLILQRPTMGRCPKVTCAGWHSAPFVTLCKNQAARAMRAPRPSPRHGTDFGCRDFAMKTRNLISAAVLVLAIGAPVVGIVKD